MAAETISAKAKTETIEKVLDEMNESHLESTVKVFRSAYYLGKSDRPFSDHFQLLELQQLNIVDIGKISVLIDESTSLGAKYALIVYSNCEISKERPPNSFFLDLIELPDQTSATILRAFLNCLNQNSFCDEYLQENLVAFASDGSSVMLGKRYGVEQNLAEKYPNIILWHCMKHRIELANFKCWIVKKVKQIGRIGETEIEKPCALFRLNVNETKNSYRDYLENSSVVPKELIPLMNCSSLIPCSSSECERGFSQMNIMVTPTRLWTSNISSLMFINLNGPNIRKWKPELYVRTWLRKHRSADDTRTKRAKPAENIDDVVNENVFS
ncbi:E3 SUMO-protein ligase KIAA1586 [Araneus ventricosus]|uniref:E3 SUMO-protein ligase KIAA1586 n=1 Tax=Araneus ventricosus TaxID=182803 RepID=A0A4Y2REI9_ARAVE|nr:E3 SUMO-protein ligase KIAA1586 [Araneus ventricosus]